MGVNNIMAIDLFLLCIGTIILGAIYRLHTQSIKTMNGVRTIPRRVPNGWIKRILRNENIIHLGDPIYSRLQN